MTYKPIEYSSHAVERMELRRIKREDVRWVLARGQWRPEHSLKGRDPRFSKRGVVGGRALEVVYTEDAHRVLVITVAWTG